MTKEEFLKLTTIFEMSDEDFDRVNSAYMELEGMDKLGSASSTSKIVQDCLECWPELSADIDAWPEKTSIASIL